MRNHTSYLRLLFTVVFLILNLTAAFAQKYTVSGYVLESGSGEPLIGVAVFSKGTSRGTVTSNQCVRLR